ncbi:MAG: hypothetical protein AB9Q19_03420 [Candidatus Reddybacter sp.]
MKKVIFAGMVLAFGATNVVANCTSGSETAASVLAGKSVSALGGAAETWNESHCGSGASGELWKVGAGTAVDPAAEIGTWSVSGNDVTYNYGTAATTYTWTLHQVGAGARYFFCNGTSLVASGTLGTLGDCSTPAP